MMVNQDYYIALPVYNEEKTLYRCINYLNQAVDLINKPLKTIICLNGCKDNSKIIAKKCEKDFPDLKIKIIQSKRGKVNAQEKILSYILPHKIIFFTDSDTFVDHNSLINILEEFKKNKELLAVGGFPRAVSYKGFNPLKKILDKILNIRSRHPKSEISKLTVTEYHKLADKDPQKINTDKQHEKRSKIFFHGRLFALRSKKYWSKPNLKKGVVGDDSYIPDYIIYNYGKNRIRIRYDAIVFFDPFISVKEHYRTYKRTFFDLENLRRSYPEFKDIRDHSSLILDKNYIKNQNVNTQMLFKLFSIIKRLEVYFFKRSKEKNPSKIWGK